ncbi:hypothetical protein CAOG_01662 [Capsaspora owczarzaki ATCC 30864]|uniref:hypothetical protein n=1 Tax=Capsaspora owczarzaki (strain ATCC 30864) TaxID=595528 RepID=UPI0003523958|nr:hypothetical protein CAOG_01662 [Capsaspora owczarzaki ATCC 30864]|eukprot:XP_004364530.2 hypothetical protein CAOG_01662 [Capsaspora owczarzaki ATCC 30864]
MKNMRSFVAALAHKSLVHDAQCDTRSQTFQSERYEVGVSWNPNRMHRASMEINQYWELVLANTPSLGDGGLARIAPPDIHGCYLDLGTPRPQALFFINDGHSGDEVARLVGQILPKLFEPIFKQVDYEIATARISESGCTNALCLIRDELNDEGPPQKVVYAANVGDTRRYNITRAFGDLQHKRQMISVPHVSCALLDEKEDTHIILVCDGVTDVLGDQDLVDIVKCHPDVEQSSTTIVQHALKSGTTDNITCIVVKLLPTSVKSKATEAVLDKQALPRLSRAL